MRNVSTELDSSISARDERQNNLASLTIFIPVGGFTCTRTYFSDRLLAVSCKRCGQEMEFRDYLPWTVHGLEGDTELERAYYVCPECEGETFFPPGSETRATSGSLE